MAQWRLLSVGLLAVVLSACTSALLQPPEESPTRTYLLQWEGNPGTSSAAGSGPVLLVSPVIAAPGFDRADMAYMRHPHQLEYFASHRWVDAPARMLDPLLVRAAAQSNGFRSVVEAGSGARVDMRLESRLVQLVQMCSLHPSELRMSLRVTLVDVPNARVIATSTLDVSEPLTEHTPVAGAAAANRGLNDLLSQLQVFLTGQVGKR